MGNYFDKSTYLIYLPSELISEILIYLDPKSIENMNKLSLSIDIIIKNKVFWINKLTFENMGMYIQFLDKYSKDYLIGYRKFIDVENIFNVLIYKLKSSNVRMGFHIDYVVNLKSFINLDLYEFEKVIRHTASISNNIIEMVTHNYENILIIIKYKNNIYKAYSKNMRVNVNEILIYEKFKLLIIKLIFTNFKMREIIGRYLNVIMFEK